MEQDRVILEVHGHLMSMHVIPPLKAACMQRLVLHVQ
jgi:hypothetical protein